MTEQSSGERMFVEVRTLEQGKNYMLDLVRQVEKAREQCDTLHKRAAMDLVVPRETLETSYRNLSVRYGQALGSLVTLMHCRVLTDEAYTELRGRVDLAMLPKVIGVVQG